MKRSGLVLASVLSVLLGSGSATPADLAEVRERGALRVLAVDQERTFEEGRPGTAFGFESDLLRAFARLHDLRVEVIRVSSWGQLVDHLLEDDGDMVAGAFTVTASRRQRISFTREVFPIRNIVVTRKPHRVAESLEQLREERVGIPRNTSVAELAKQLELPPENVDSGFTPDEIFGALGSERITAGIVEVGESILAAREDPQLQLGILVGPRESYAWGVRKDESELRQALDDYLLNSRRSARWNRLVVKHYGDDALELLRLVRGEGSR